MYYCLIYVFLTYISLTNYRKYVSMYIFVMKYLLKFCVLFVTWINHYLVDLKLFFQFSSVQSVSCVQICNPMNCSMPGLPAHHQLPGLTQTHVLPVGDDIQPSYPLILIHLPSTFPSIMVFSNELVLHMRWPKYWSFSFSISPSNEYSRLISFRTDWLDLFAVQGTLKSLLQHHSSRAPIIWHSAFLIVQLSHPYMTTGKTRAWTRWTFVGK